MTIKKILHPKLESSDIAYGFFRFLIEYFREPDEHIGLIYFDFSMGQILSLPMIISGLYFIIIFNNKKIKY